ncbi:hypothetical protein K0M31_019093 [Melipona bicolor]|uniref:Uncharacterized protein n=1 Tax=Melipona bicolor TaxID=60889 RepID=A0AA40KQT3_9HYME|nr:hypothetical protein K0M31_019093 [Melipona bicolor]
MEHKLEFCSSAEKYLEDQPAYNYSRIRASESEWKDDIPRHCFSAPNVQATEMTPRT